MAPSAAPCCRTACGWSPRRSAPAAPSRRRLRRRRLAARDATLHGASHFLEHVLFKGTPRRTAEEISAAIESVGGELNAYTAKEHTCFYARVLHGDAELAVDVLTDMISNSLIRAPTSTPSGR